MSVPDMPTRLIEPIKPDSSQRLQSCRTCTSFSVCAMAKRYRDVTKADTILTKICFRVDHSQLEYDVLEAVAANCRQYMGEQG